jgi:hypothetical protein
VDQAAMEPIRAGPFSDFFEEDLILGALE